MRRPTAWKNSERNSTALRPAKWRLAVGAVRPIGSSDAERSFIEDAKSAPTLGLQMRKPALSSVKSFTPIGRGPGSTSNSENGAANRERGSWERARDVPTGVDLL
jgi:hypothetical protein